MSEPTISPASGEVAALRARLDAMPADAAPAARAIVSADGREIRLTLYTEAGPAAVVALDPVRAVALAGELIAAALPKLRAP